MAELRKRRRGRRSVAGDGMRRPRRRKLFERPQHNLTLARPPTPAQLDSQVVELVGRQYLIGELFRANLEVALPVRDRGVDLVAYRERAAAGFLGVPIQVKASSTRGWGINRKYAKTANLLLTHVWNVSAPEHLEIYAMSYQEALEIGEAMGYLKTPSWTTGGAYSTSAPSKKLLSLLATHRMTSERWGARLEKSAHTAR